jgi:hypothetical protein
MKLNKETLKKIIKEEMENLLKESSYLPHFDKMIDLLTKNKADAMQAIALMETIPEYGVIDSEEKYGKITIYFEDEASALEIHEALDFDPNVDVFPPENEFTNRLNLETSYQGRKVYYVAIRHY